MTFGEKLLQLRKAKGLSQENLALQIDVSRQAVSRWEAGAAMPDAPNLLQISKMFAVTTDYLLNDDYASDKDILAIKLTEDSIKKEQNRQIALAVLVGLQSLAFFLGVLGWFGYRLYWVMFIALIMHLVNIIGFEMGYRRSTPSVESRVYRRKYYRIAVWLFSYFPVRIMVVSLWSLYPRPYTSLAFEGSILLVYLIVCIITTVSLRKK